MLYQLKRLKTKKSYLKNFFQIQILKKKGLKNANGDGGGANGHDLEDPPDPGHEKQAHGELAGPGEFEDLAVGIHGIRQARVKIEEGKYAQAQENEKDALPVYGLFFRGQDEFLRHLGEAAGHGHFFAFARFTGAYDIRLGRHVYEATGPRP